MPAGTVCCCYSLNESDMSQQHQFVNTGPTPLILYTVYSPAEHKPTSVHKTKEQGDQEEEDGIDVAPDWSRKSKAENEKAGLVEGED